MSLRVYISGPMAGFSDHNYDAFYGAAVTLRGMGHKVLNPAELGADLGDDWSAYLCRDCHMLVDFRPEVIVTLPGWEASKGACVEIFLGRMLFNAECVDFDTFIHRGK